PRARARARQGLSDDVATCDRCDADRRCTLCAQRHPRAGRKAASALAAGRCAMSAPAMLETQALCKNFGALEVAREVNFRLERGARHALIGPNGAGKTTFVNLLTGLLA